MGSPFVYTFTAPHAGTYMYHCHIDTVLHIEKGMYGTIIVRPANGSTTEAWAGGPIFDKEYVWHLHTFDSSWHGEDVSSTIVSRYRPDYFMINGNDGNNALSDITSAIEADAGSRVLVRVNNVGYQPALVELDGIGFQIIASDGRPLPVPLNLTEIMIAAGERYDVLFTMPIGIDGMATISYKDIRNRNILGSVQTKIRDTSNLIFSNGFE